MKLTNYMMDAMIERLKPFLERSDIVGYAAARNVRKLQDGCLEFQTKRQDLVMKYGTEQVDDEGNPTGSYVIKEGQEGYEETKGVLETLANLEHEVEIYQIPIEDTIGILSGREMLELGFMLTEDEGDGDA